MIIYCRPVASDCFTLWTDIYFIGPLSCKGFIIKNKVTPVWQRTGAGIMSAVVEILNHIFFRMKFESVDSSSLVSSPALVCLISLFHLDCTKLWSAFHVESLQWFWYPDHLCSMQTFLFSLYRSVTFEAEAMSKHTDDWTHCWSSVLSISQLVS